MDSILSTWDSVTGKAGGELRVELYIDDGHPKETFAALQARRATIEAELRKEIPEDLTWYSKETVRACKLYVSRPSDSTR